MRKRRLLLFSVVLTLAVLWAFLRLEAPSYLEFFELRVADFRIQSRGQQAVGDSVAIIAIDEKSLDERGRFPWARSQMAALISKLTELGAAVIALDIIFAEPTSAEEDQKLADAITQSGKVVLGYFLEFGGTADDASGTFASSYNLVKPSGSPGLRHLTEASDVESNIPVVARAARRAGFLSFIPDADGMFRQALLAARFKDKILIPLSLEAVRVYRGGELLTMALEDYGVSDVLLGRSSIPTDERGEMWINYAGPARTFAHHSATDVLSGKVSAEDLRGRIALVGATATGIFDLRATPVDPVYPGVEIHATVIDNILNGRYIYRPKWIVIGDISIILVLGLSLGTILIWVPALWGGVLSVAVGVAYAWGTEFVFLNYGVPLSLIYPLLSISTIYLTITLLRYMKEEREKRRVRSAFNLYLHPEVARMVSEDPGLLRLGGKKQELTVMFTDIRGFTSISETLDPEDLVEFLNEYLGAMTDIVFHHDGLLDKYIGDAIMALWGAPLPKGNHAELACLTALDMRTKLHEMQIDWRERGLPPIEMGVGINTGPMVVGNMGSYQRFNYTVMGDHVNLASRLEGLNKMYDTRVLLSESTLAQIGDEFLTREIDAVRVKGKTQPVRIYELLGRVEGAGDLAQLVERFNEALKDYKARDWQQALALWSSLLTDFPNDGPAQMYVERSRALIEDPPGPDWDGVFTATSK